MTFNPDKFRPDPKPPRTPKKVKKPIKKVSEKRKKDNKEYTALRQVYLLRNPLCEVKLKGCFGKASEIHHDLGRGINLNNIDSFVAICRNCHNIVEDKNIKVKPINQKP